MRQPLKKIIFSISIVLCCVAANAQGPDMWIFGRNAGLDFNPGQVTPITKETDNCYSPVSIQCDETGNLLFYCDGRTIRDRNGAIMPGSSNAVWPSPHITMEIRSNIVPATEDTNRYYVFSISPSSGVVPFGSYYSGALTYSIVDMRLNNGNGGIDPNYNNILLDTNLSRFMLVVPAKACNNHWLVVGKSVDYGTSPASFLSYRISENGISQPVSSSIGIDSMDKYQSFREFDMIYAYKHRKIIERYGAYKIGVHDFNDATGLLSNGTVLLNLSEFISPGGGVIFPKLCLASEEKFLYMLGYINGISLRQYPIMLDTTVPSLGNPVTVFQTDDPTYKTPSPQISLGFGWNGCDIRRGPDNKIYLFYNTGQSFAGQVNNPDNQGMACNVAPQGVQLLPNTFGSYFFPAIENKRIKVTNEYRTHDTTLCFIEPFIIKAPIPGVPGYKYVWNDGSTHASYTVKDEGTYWVRSTGDCSDVQYTDTFHVTFEPAEKCNCKVFIPNAFSPNNDQVNDLFKPIVPATCINSGYVFRIFNRWGQSVFYTNNLSSGWDGKMKGELSDLGTYYYFISFNDASGTTKTVKGDFLLLR